MTTSIEAYTDDENTRDYLFFHRETKWYPNYHKEDGNERLRRVMTWHEETIYGEVEFYMYNKKIYDRIFEYFGLGKKRPPSLLSSFEFLEHREKKFVTEWEFEEGAVKCYHRWWGNNDSEDDEDSDGSGQIDESEQNDDKVSKQIDGSGQDDDEISDGSEQIDGSGIIEVKIKNKEMFVIFLEYAVKFKP